MIKIYKFLISPLLGNHCRFFPSCSDYMQEAIHTHGLLKGIKQGLWRLMCCHPFCSKNGWDPVKKVRTHD